jgi:hypothetical protein
MNIALLWLGSAFWLGSLLFTLLRLAYDEWQQWRLSRKAPAVKEVRPSEVEYATWKTATM